jgi:hypothetical protein
MHVANETWETEDMTALGHPGGYGRVEANGTGGVLGEVGSEDLQDIVPVEVDVGIDALGAIVAAGVYDEAVVGMDISAWC